MALEAKSQSDVRTAGLLYVLSGTVMFLAISLAEALYPGYSVHTNAISDLAATAANTSGLVEAAGLVWGLGWLAGSYLLLRGTGRRGLMVLFLLPGIGVLLRSAPRRTSTRPSIPWGRSLRSCREGLR